MGSFSQTEKEALKSVIARAESLLSDLTQAQADILTNASSVSSAQSTADDAVSDAATAQATAAAALLDKMEGPPSSTDEAVARYTGTGGTALQDSGVTIDDSGNLTVVGNIVVSGTVDTRDVASDGTKLDGIESGAEVNLTKEYWSGYDTTGGVTLTSAATVTIDTVLKSSGATFTLSSNELQIDKTGTYMVTIDFTATEGTSSRAGAEAWLEEDSGGFAEVTGSRCSSYIRIAGADYATGSSTVIVDITSGDKIRVRAQRTVGAVANSQTAADKSRLTVVEL